jgi:hypothetical protein
MKMLHGNPSCSTTTIPLPYGQGALKGEGRCNELKFSYIQLINVSVVS